MLLIIMREPTNKCKKSECIFCQHVALFLIPCAAMVHCLSIATIFLRDSHIFKMCTLPQYPHSLASENRLIERACFITKHDLPKKKRLPSRSLILHYHTVLLLMLSQCFLQLLTAIAKIHRLFCH